MGKLTVHPGKLRGGLAVPASKSLGHRAILCAGLAKGESRISGLTRSADIDATAAAIEALGAKIGVDGETVWGGAAATAEEIAIDCNESGSTLRFLIPIVLALGQKTRFLMRGRLGQRPLEPYAEICRKQGLYYRQEGDILTVAGQLRPGTFTLSGRISSQFISGLLFALPLLPGPSAIEIAGPLESREYVTLTVEVLRQFGIDADWREGRIAVPGGQTYRPGPYRVEGDFSQAAFFLAANALGSEILLQNLNPGSAQGDRAILDILAAMGSETEFVAESLRTVAGRLRGARIDAAQCPDLVPVLAGLAGFAAGKTEIVHAGRLRIKECDRLAASREELKKLGIDIEESGDGLVIAGRPIVPGGAEAWSHRDHRIAMTLAVAATACREPVTIADWEAVEKSYPRFFADFEALGGKIS